MPRTLVVAAGQMGPASDDEAVDVEKMLGLTIPPSLPLRAQHVVRP